MPKIIPRDTPFNQLLKYDLNRVKYTEDYVITPDEHGDYYKVADVDKLIMLLESENKLLRNHIKTLESKNGC